MAESNLMVPPEREERFFPSMDEDTRAAAAKLEQKLADGKDLTDLERAIVEEYRAVTELEEQVEGSLSVYSHPQYKEIHSLIRREIEDIIGSQLYDTYYYDRVYFVGQELERHLDRDACEISVTVHIGSNLDECWPIALKTVDQDNVSVCLEPGDAMVYKEVCSVVERNPYTHNMKAI